MTLHLIDDKTAPKSQRFRWHLKGQNGKIVAASSEGFSSAQNCAKNIVKTMEGIYEFVSFNSSLDCDIVEFSDADAVKVRQ